MNTNESFHDDEIDLPKEAFTDVDEMEDREEEIRARELDDERWSSDMSDDADALASAGHGTDEDYNGGCFNDME